MNTAKPSKTRASGLAWSLCGFLLGSIVSVGGNLQSAWLPADQPGTPDGWAPSWPSQVFAVVWPLSLIVSVEVLSRVTWPEGKGWWWVRTGGILLVAGGSGVISYGHIHEVLTAWGYDPYQAIVGPLVIDGLMLISGFALVSIGRAARAAVEIALAPVVESPAGPARTDSARRPHTPSPTGDEPHAVSPTTPHDAVGETAPEPTARATRPSIRAVARPATTRPPRRQTKPPAGDLSEEDLDLIARLRAARNPDTGELPKVPWMRTEFGIGQPRAARLREAAARPELHTVKEEVAAG